MKTLLFHIGRGGRFNNAGHLSFSEVGGIDGAPIIMNGHFNYPVLGEDEDGNLIDDQSDDAELLNDCGNGIGLTAGELRANEGRIDIDGEYNTWYTRHSDNLSDREAQAVLDYYKDEQYYVYDTDLDLLIEIADTTNLTDDIAAFIQQCDLCDICHSNVKATANDWLTKNGYDAIEDED